MDTVPQLLLLGLAAEIAIPLGGWLAKCEHIHPRWGENELRHFIIALLRTKISAKRILTAFALLALMGPLSTTAGYFFLADYKMVLKCIMLFASGGILYLVFQDIAPQSQIKKHWLPASGAVAGFLLGLVGHLMSK